MGEWIKVARVDQVPAGTMLRVDVAGEPVCVYNVAGTLCATHDTCTHEQASLSEGYLDGPVVECPLHQATFDVRTGKSLTPPATDDLKAYEIDVDAGDIRIRAP